MLGLNIYLERRQKLLKLLGKGVVIIPSYPERVLSNDTNHKYRQQSELLYYSGFPEPNTTVVLEFTDESEIYHLFVPKRDKLQETWNGKRLGVEGAIDKYGADFAYETEELELKLIDILKKHQTVFYQTKENLQTDIIIENAIENAVNAKDRVNNGPVRLINPIDIYHKIRSVKSAEEIEFCEKSAQISAEAITTAMKKTKVGMTEYQIEAIIDFEFRYKGAERAAYPSICGNGSNATILHYIENQDELIDGNLILVDAGCQYQNYCSDITRTWPINGKFSETQRKIYELVLAIQKECIDMIRPNIKFLDVSDHALKLITKGLLELGLLQGDLENLIKEKKYKRFFMHGLGHWVGLDVHDTSRFNIREEMLVPGLYLTIEPGIYIPEDEDIPIEFRGIGIRIEDDVLVTETGHRVLTNNVVKEISEIEAIVGTL